METPVFYHIDLKPSHLTLKEFEEISVLNNDNGDSDMSQYISFVKGDLSRGDDMSRITLAKVNGETIGWSLVEKWKGIRKYLTLISVFVRPDFRGRGIGERLAQTASAARTQISDQLPSFSEDDIAFYKKVLPEYFLA